MKKLIIALASVSMLSMTPIAQAHDHNLVPAIVGSLIVGAAIASSNQHYQQPVYTQYQYQPQVVYQQTQTYTYQPQTVYTPPPQVVYVPQPQVVYQQPEVIYAPPVYYHHHHHYGW